MQGNAYTGADLTAHPVSRIRFWPMIFDNAFSENAGRELVTIFGQTSVYLIVLKTKTDPFPGTVSSSLSSASRLIRRSWAQNRRFFLIGYFGPLVPTSAVVQADRIRASTRR